MLLVIGITFFSAGVMICIFVCKLNKTFFFYLHLLFLSKFMILFLFKPKHKERCSLMVLMEKLQYGKNAINVIYFQAF